MTSYLEMTAALTNTAYNCIIIKGTMPKTNDAISLAVWLLIKSMH